MQRTMELMFSVPSRQLLIAVYRYLFTFYLSFLSLPTVFWGIVNTGSGILNYHPKRVQALQVPSCHQKAKSDAGKQTNTPGVSSGTAKQWLTGINQLAYNWETSAWPATDHGGCRLPWNLPFKRKRAKEGPFITTSSPFIRHHKVNCFKEITSVVLTNPHWPGYTI